MEQNRIPKGIRTAGQFAAHHHPEPDLDLAPAGPADSPAGIIRANTEPVTLLYTAYDDRLSTEQISMVLAGQWSDAENSVEDTFSDYLYDQATSVARTEINDAYEAGRIGLEWDELDLDEQDEARQAVRERDDSDPLKDLLRNTPPQLLRTSLGNPQELLSDPSAASGLRLDTGGFEARTKALGELLKKAGIDTSAPGVQDEIEALVNEGPYNWHEGVRAELIWYGDVEDATPSPCSDDPDKAGRKVLEFSTPRVLLIDRINGSGYDTTIPSPLKKILEKPDDEGGEAPATGRVYLDSDAGGYSWDDVAGLHKPAYKDGAPAASWSG